MFLFEILFSLYLEGRLMLERIRNFTSPRPTRCEGSVEILHRTPKEIEKEEERIYRLGLEYIQEARARVLHELERGRKRKEKNSRKTGYTPLDTRPPALSLPGGRDPLFLR